MDTAEADIDALQEAVGNASKAESAEGAGDGVAATGLFKKVEDEIARATSAEEDLGDRVKAIEDDYVTSQELEDAVGAVEVPVLGVAEDDKILALGADKLISATVSMSYDETDKAIKLYGKDNVELGSVDATPFIKDGMLDNVEYDAESNTLTFTWNTDSGKTTDTVVLSDIIEPYTAGDGLKLEGNKFSVKLADGSESFLTVSADGLKLSGIQTAIDTAAGTAKSEAIADAEGKIATAKQEAIDAAADAAAGIYATKEYVGVIPNGEDGNPKAANVVAYIEKKAEEVLSQATGGSSESAASVKAQLDTFKAEINPKVTKNTEDIAAINEKLTTIEENADVNVIEKVKVNGTELTPDENKAVDITVPTKFSDLTDDSGFGARIDANATGVSEAKGLANAAQTTANEAKTAATNNGNAIGELTTTVAGHTTTIGEHTTKIANLEAADEAHAAEFTSLKQTVQGHTTAIAGKAEQTALDAVSAKATQNESAIKTLNETTVPDLQEAINGKVATTAFDKFKEDNTAAIEAAKQEAISAATYNDTQVKADIKANADAIAALDETYATDAELAAAVEELEGKIGNITVPVTSVTGDDRVISVANTEGVHKVSATLGLKYTAATADANAKIELVGINDTVLGTIDASDFVKDGMLESVTKNETDNTITFTWNTDAGKQTTTIDIDELVEVYTAGNGIDISNYSISAKVDATSENFLTVGQNGIKLAGVQAAIEEAKQAAIDDADGKLAAAKEELEGKITAVDQDFVKEVQINGTALPATDKKVNIPVALASALGVVKGSADAVQTEGVWSGENKIMVAEDGTMEVNKVNVNKLVQNEGDVLILNSGNALA